MTAKSPIVYGALSGRIVAQVRDAVSGMRNLGHILSWGAACTPPRKPNAVITQDEYTHDVIMLFADGVYAVFDVT